MHATLSKASSSRLAAKLTTSRSSGSSRRLVVLQLQAAAAAAAPPSFLLPAFHLAPPPTTTTTRRLHTASSSTQQQPWWETHQTRRTLHHSSHLGSTSSLSAPLSLALEFDAQLHEPGTQLVSLVRLKEFEAMLEAASLASLDAETKAEVRRALLLWLAGQRGVYEEMEEQANECEVEAREDGREGTFEEMPRGLDELLAQRIAEASDELGSALGLGTQAFPRLASELAAEAEEEAFGVEEVPVGTFVTLRKLVRLASYRRASVTLTMLTRRVSSWTANLARRRLKPGDACTQPELRQRALVVTHAEALYATLMHVYSKAARWTTLCSMTDQLGIFRHLTKAKFRMAPPSETSDSASTSATASEAASAAYDEALQSSNEAINNLRHFKIRLRCDRAFRPRSEQAHGLDEAFQASEPPWATHAHNVPMYVLTERKLIGKARNRAMHNLQVAHELLDEMQRGKTWPDTAFLAEFLKTLQRATDLERLIDKGVVPTKHIREVLYASPRWREVRGRTRMLARRAWRLFERSWSEGEVLATGVRPTRGLTALLHDELGALEPLLPIPNGVGEAALLQLEVKEGMEVLRRLVRKLEVWLDESVASRQAALERYEEASLEEQVQLKLDAQHVAARAAHLSLRLNLRAERAEAQLASARTLIELPLPELQRDATLLARHVKRQIQTCQRAGLVAIFNAALEQNDVDAAVGVLELCSHAASFGIFDAEPLELQEASSSSSSMHEHDAKPSHVRATQEGRTDPLETLSRIWARAVVALPHFLAQAAHAPRMIQEPYMVLSTPHKLASMRATLPNDLFRTKPRVPKWPAAMQDRTLDVLLATLGTLKARHKGSEVNWEQKLEGVFAQPKVIEPLVKHAIRVPVALNDEETQTQTPSFTLRAMSEIEARLAKVACMMGLLDMRGEQWRIAQMCLKRTLSSCEGRAKVKREAQRMLDAEQLKWRGERGVEEMRKLKGGERKKVVRMFDAQAQVQKLIIEVGTVDSHLQLQLFDEGTAAVDQQQPQQSLIQDVSAAAEQQLAEAPSSRPIAPPHNVEGSTYFTATQPPLPPSELWIPHVHESRRSSSSAASEGTREREEEEEEVGSGVEFAPAGADGWRQ